LFWTSPEMQRFQAERYARNPTRIALYEDTSFVSGSPILTNLRNLLANSVARPARMSGANYARVSAEFFDAVNGILSGGAVETRLAEMERAIRRAARGR